MTTMQHPGLMFARRPRQHHRRPGERRSSVHQRVLVAIVALAVCAWVIVVQQETPEVDANTARETLVVLDELLADNGAKDR